MDRNTLISTKKQMIMRKIEKEIDQIPSLPDNIEKISLLIANPNFEIKQISSVIKRDPALMFDVLKIANSARYKTRNRVATIERAITIIGIRELSIVVMRIGALRIIEEFYVPIETITKHSNVCALFAQKLIKKKNPAFNSEIAYTAGLLHDIGKLIFLTVIPGIMDKIDNLSEVKGIDTWELERLAIGLTHAEIGAKITEKWGFPKEIVSSIDYHHNPLFVVGEEKELVYCVYLANILSYYTEVSPDIMLRIENKVLDFFDINSEDELSKLLSNLISSSDMLKHRAP